MRRGTLAFRPGPFRAQAGGGPASEYIVHTKWIKLCALLCACILEDISLQQLWRLDVDPSTAGV